MKVLKAIMAMAVVVTALPVELEERFYNACDISGIYSRAYCCEMGVLGDDVKYVYYYVFQYDYETVANVVLRFIVVLVVSYLFA